MLNRSKMTEDGGLELVSRVPPQKEGKTLPPIKVKIIGNE